MISFNRIRKNVYILISHGIVARGLSLLQGVLIAFYIGTSTSTDIYFLAFATTMLLTKIITEGMLVSLIPLYHQIDKRDGQKGRYEFTNNVLNSYVLLGLVLTTIGIIFAPYIIRLMGPGFSGEEFERAVKLFRIGAPIMIFDFIRVIGSGYLQSIHAFRAGARSGISYNLIFIIYILFLSPYFGIEGLMVTGIMAVISQIIILWIPVFKDGYKYKFYLLLKDRLLIRLNSFILPIVIGVGMNEVNLVVDNAIGSTLQTGTIAELNYANDIITFFITLFIVALVTATFPVLSERFRDDNPAIIRKSFRYSLKIILLASIPIALLFMTMAEPMVRLFYQRGEFTLEATLRTAAILRYYAPAVVGMSLLLLLNRIFYAVHSLITPVVIGIIGLVTNVILSILLAQFIGSIGIALGTTISVGIVSLYALIKLNMLYNLFDFKDVIAKSSKLIFASVSMVVVILFLNNNVANMLQTTNIGNLVLVIISAIFGVITFAGVTSLLKI